MPDKCPRCGADPVPAMSLAAHIDAAWECGSAQTFDITRSEMCRLRSEVQSARRVIDVARKVAAGGRVYVSELRELLAEYDREVHDDD